MFEVTKCEKTGGHKSIEKEKAKRSVRAESKNVICNDEKVIV